MVHGRWCTRPAPTRHFAGRGKRLTLSAITGEHGRLSASPSPAASTSRSSPAQAPRARAPNATSQQVGPGPPQPTPLLSVRGCKWGPTPLSSNTPSPRPIRAGEDTSSISRPGGTPGWLWNLWPGSRVEAHNATTQTTTSDRSPPATRPRAETKPQRVSTQHAPGPPKGRGPRSKSHDKTPQSRVTQHPRPARQPTRPTGHTVSQHQQRPHPKGLSPDDGTPPIERHTWARNMPLFKFMPTPRDKPLKGTRSFAGDTHPSAGPRAETRHEPE